MKHSPDIAQKLLHYKIPEIVQQRTARDTILYALSIGMGQDPLSKGQLRYVYEKDLLAVPTMAVILGQPFGWFHRSGLGFGLNSVQAAQHLKLHRPIPVEGRFVGISNVTDVVDKGPGKGAIVIVERILFHEGSGDAIATSHAVSYCRGDGGFGGENRNVAVYARMPDGPPDTSCVLDVLPQAAILYRLHGDPTPLHIDPDYARNVGFRQPILHGLFTYGVACHAILKTCCGYDPKPIRAIEARFTAPAYPGEAMRVDLWRRGDGVFFRVSVPERDDSVILDNGYAELGGTD